jgi:hypothetical protein
MLNRIMKVRLDLLAELTEEDLLEAVLAENHRYKPEPNFAKTGIGYLKPATPEDRERELKHGEELIRRLEERARLRREGNPPKKKGEAP